MHLVQMLLPLYDMVDPLDRTWWKGYRHTLEERFRQEKLLVRALQVETL
jgi:hypothetical protein